MKKASTPSPQEGNTVIEKSGGGIDERGEDVDRNKGIKTEICLVEEGKAEKGEEMKFPVQEEEIKEVTGERVFSVTRNPTIEKKDKE